MTDTQTVPETAENWESGNSPKPSKFAKFINIRDIGKQIENDDKSGTRRGRKPKVYTLTKPVAEIVARRVYQTVGLATRCMDIWALSDDEAKALAESSVPVFNALPEKLRTFAGEQGSRAGLALALFQFANTVKNVTMPRIVATKVRQLENDPEFQAMTAMDDTEFSSLFATMAANGRTGTDG